MPTDHTYADTDRMWLRDPGEPDDRLDSEDACLELIDRHFPTASGHFPHGRGDDCAELADLPGTLALSSDMFWQDSHFRTQYFIPAEAGAKALASSVSDLAAAGAVPLGFSLGLMLASGIGKKTLAGMLGGMSREAGKYGIVLTGGDLTLGERTGFSLCVWGKSAEDGSFLRRRQAAGGDCLFMLGNPGLARVGFRVLERFGRGALRDWPEACAAHLAPEPLLDAGQRISRIARAAESDSRFSLMDVSDGLARDLPRLLGSFGAEIRIEPKRIHPEIRKAATLMGCPPEEIFLLGGEEYGLLGTCPQEYWPQMEKAIPGAFLLGRVISRPGIFLDGKLFAPEGFDHFDRRQDGTGSKSLTGKTISCGAANAIPGYAARAGMTAGCEPGVADNDHESSGSVPGSDLVSTLAYALASLGRDAWKGGLMAGFNGNISGRIDTPPAFLVTRSGAAKGRLERRDFIPLCLERGEPLPGLLPEAPTGASSESPMHLAIYKACPESRVILHTHPPALLALSLALEPGQRLLLPLPEAERYREKLRHTPFFPPGSRELAEAVAGAATLGPAVWMERHGLMVHGTDPVEALALTEELEQLARVQLDLLGAVSR